MLPSALEGVRHKLIRAQKHLDEARALIEKCAHGEWGIAPEKDSEQRVTGLRINLLPKADPEIGAIAGDALFALRSALDHIVWQLVLVNLPNILMTGIQFPIATSFDEFRRAILRKRLRGVTSRAVTLIESLQPYKTGHNPLKTLNTLHNIDKHRTLNVVTVVADKSEIIARYGDEPVFKLLLDNDEMKDGKVFGEIGPPFDLPAEFASINKRLSQMPMNGRCSLFVNFDEPTAQDLEDLRVDRALQGVHDFIRDTVIPAFEPFFA